MTAAPPSGRDAILLAARRAFAHRPYADVTLRGIAAAAGVSASLIVKHFGTKEQLFHIVADFTGSAEELLAAEPERLGRHMVLALIRSRRDQRGDPLVRVVFSLGVADERAVIREHFREQVTRRLTEMLTGPDAQLRAELVIAQLLGLGASLSLHGDGASAAAGAEEIADLYAPGVQRLITP